MPIAGILGRSKELSSLLIEIWIALRRITLSSTKTTEGKAVPNLSWKNFTAYECWILSASPHFQLYHTTFVNLYRKMKGKQPNPSAKSKILFCIAQGEKNKQQNVQLFQQIARRLVRNMQTQSYGLAEIASRCPMKTQIAILPLGAYKMWIYRAATGACLWSKIRCW